MNTEKYNYLVREIKFKSLRVLTEELDELGSIGWKLVQINITKGKAICVFISGVA